MKQVIVIYLSLLIAGCTSALLTQDQETIFGALNSKVDGYSFKSETSGDVYTIISTYANDTRLCRVVSLKNVDRFIVESYCKVKGGQWR